MFWAPGGSPGRLFNNLGPQKADFGDDHIRGLVGVPRVRENSQNFENAISRDFVLRGLRGGIVEIGCLGPFRYLRTALTKNGPKWPKSKEKKVKQKVKQIKRQKSQFITEKNIIYFLHLFFLFFPCRSYRFLFFTSFSHAYLLLFLFPTIFLFLFHPRFFRFLCIFCSSLS